MSAVSQPQAEYLNAVKSRILTLLEITEEAITYGSGGSRESEYQEIRQWLLRFYPSAKSSLSIPAQVPSEGADSWSGKPSDSLEKLIAPSTLQTLTMQPVTTLQARIYAVRSALESLESPLAVAYSGSHDSASNS